VRPVSLFPRTKLERGLLFVLALCVVVPLAAVAVLSGNESITSASGGFQVSFVSLILLLLCFVSLLGIGRIHRRLAPLEHLLEGTRRLAPLDPQTAPAIPNGDEFEEIASFFTAMASRLAKQLSSMATMVEIDRLIHSAVDATGIVNALLTRIREVHPCDALLVTLADPGNPDVLQTFVSDDERPEGELVQQVGFSPEEIGRLTAHPDHQLVRVDDDLLPCLEPFLGTGVERSLVLPLFVRGHLAGLIALGYRDPRQHDEEQVVYLRQLADHAAIAFGNTRLVAENHLLAYYDGLTGLPNRRMYKEQLSQALRRAEHRKRPVATCFLDLDGFQRINERLGHEGGDRLLREVGKRLSRSVRFSDAVARSRPHDEDFPISRLGGDEFTLLLTEVTDSQDAARVARRVLKALSEPFAIDGHEVFTSASMGIAIYPTDGRDPDDLLRNADTAMFCAKGRGRNNFQFYTRSMNAEASRRLHLETRLRQALKRRELALHYQPILAANGGALIGAEALLRWDDPEMGGVRPDEFVPIAEESGLIVPIGEWVLRTACAQCREWHEAGFPDLRMAVNLSGHQLRLSNLVETVARVLEETGLSPTHLELEITESTIMQDDDATIAAFEQLRQMGVGLALDDFGTGYSSLSYLRRFALTRVKIDRSFVKGIPDDPYDGALTAAIIGMAHSIGLKVVAEGVETPEQAGFLTERHCDELQGFLFSRAVAAEEFSHLIEAEPRKPARVETP
jgi:diguanylate cyclase (GGDEF)-like protein